MKSKDSKRWLWYLEDESRVWKRKFQQFELLVVAIMIAASVAVTYLYGDGTNFQPAYIAFSIGGLILPVFLIPIFGRQPGINRVQRWFIILGNIGIGGLVSLCGFLILTAQAGST